MLEKHLDQPVLIIKTSWGGKSIHYDFRPPSAGPYQLTAEREGTGGTVEGQERRRGTNTSPAEAPPLRWCRWKRRSRRSKTRSEACRQSIAKLPKDQQAAEQEKLAAMNAKSKELRSSLSHLPATCLPTMQAGFYWNEMIGFVRKVLADPKAYHPEYDPKAGYRSRGWIVVPGIQRPVRSRILRQLQQQHGAFHPGPAERGQAAEDALRDRRAGNRRHFLRKP